MRECSFIEYIESYIANVGKVNDRAKVRFFIDYLRNYLREKRKDGTLSNPEVFGFLDKEFFLSSIESYIDERNPARNVAESYKRAIKELCEKVCNDYAIRNMFLESYPEQNEFDRVTSLTFDGLKQSESRDCMSTDEYEMLDMKYKSFIKMDGLDAKIKESIGKARGYNYYGRLVSAITFSLVDKFGLDNKTIANLRTTDLSISNKKLNIKEFRLDVDDELIAIFELYLKYRDLVTEKCVDDSNILFLTRTGKPYINKNGQADNGPLFTLVDTDKPFDVSGLQNRAIVRMVSKGANINLLYELTGTTEQTIAKLCDYGPDERAKFEKLFSRTREAYYQEHRIRSKGYIQCPFCGNYKDASSENWILIQIEGQKKKHIACRECKGLDGEYKY